MNRNLAAYALACVAMSILLATCTHFTPRPDRPVEVTIRSDSDVSSVVSTLSALHRSDIDIRTYKSRPESNWFFTLVAGSLGMMVLTGLVLLLYKFFCRLLRVSPTL